MRGKCWSGHSQGPQTQIDKREHRRQCFFCSVWRLVRLSEQNYYPNENNIYKKQETRGDNIINGINNLQKSM